MKEITLEMTYAQAAALFVGGLEWSIVQREEGKEDQVFDFDWNIYSVNDVVVRKDYVAQAVKVGTADNEF